MCLSEEKQSQTEGQDNGSELVERALQIFAELAEDQRQQLIDSAKELLSNKV